MSAEANWAIVGGGLLGMTMAYRLAQKGCDVTLFEAGPDLGGLADAWTIGDITWDRHYHVTLLSDSSTRRLLDDLGLDKLMHWKKSKTGFYADAQLYPFSSAIDFARFPILNPIEKVRLATTILRASRLKDWKSIEDLTVEQWLTQLSGEGVFRKIWRPLLMAKLGEEYKTTSATFIWATIQRLYAARRSGIKEEMFGYLPGGYAVMLKAFASALTAAQVRIRRNAKVKTVTSHDARIQIDMDGSEPQSFQRVVMTTPAPLTAKLCPQIDPLEKERLTQVSYLGIICGSVLLERPLTPYYVTNILDSSIPFTGLIEMSALVDPEQLKNHGLLYIPRYLNPGHPDFDRPDEDLQSEMLMALKRMHPSVAENKILAFQTSRARYVFPRPTPGYSHRVPNIDSSVRGLSIVNSAHILNGTLNVNETVALAEREALRLYALGTKPLASISLDLDDKWTYMKTHGDPRWSEYPSYLEIVIPRVLEFLKRMNLKITFFIVGQDAAFERNHKVLRSIADAGHEISNHSFHHEPWLHLYSEEQLQQEFEASEKAIESATGRRTIGFRGPGFSVSETVIKVLITRGYQYDASTLPTFLGPLARAYYFFTAKLSPEEKKRRAKLFGTLADGLRPLKSHIWKSPAGSITEIPVTTIPVVRTPFHLSYLIYLHSFSSILAAAYMHLAFSACKLVGVSPSFLLHPLDFLGPDESPELAFFPGMKMSAQEKLNLADRTFKALAKRFTLVSMSDHAHAG